MRATYPAQLILLDLIILIIFEEQALYIMELLIIQFSPASRHFIPLRSKYSPQHPVLVRISSNSLLKWTLETQGLKVENGFKCLSAGLNGRLL
jgi:hypothetical protein